MSLDVYLTKTKHCAGCVGTDCGGFDPEEVFDANITPALRPTAYVVGFFGVDDGFFKGAGIFSEDSPTLGAALCPVTLVEGRGTNYEEGLADLRRIFRHSPYVQWIRRHLSGRDENAMPPFEDPSKEKAPQ